MTNLFAILGKNISSNEVLELLDEIAPVRISEAPPFRSYIGSPEQGIDLVVESERIRAVQIYTRGTSTFRPYGRDLPLGIRVGMTQANLHQLLGLPFKESDVASHFLISKFEAKMTISFREGDMWLLSLAPL